MFTIPPFQELKETLENPSSPIGKRMRAAYYCKQLYTNHVVANQQTESNDSNVIVELLCKQVFQRSHGSLMRHEFAYVLGQMQTPRACTALEDLLTTTDDCVMVRHEAAEALGAIASETSKPILQQVYQDYHGTLDELADTCALALHRIDHPNEDVGCACMLPAYNSSVDPVEADPQHVDLTTEQLGTILCDSNVSLLERYRAMFSLRNRGGNDSVEQLGRALVSDHSSPLLRHEVAFVLGQLQHPTSISALETSLRRTSEHVMVRHEAAEALGAIETTSLEEWQTIEHILTEFQADSVQAVAESCIVALDAADYWGHNLNNTNANEDECATFGQQKRQDEATTQVDAAKLERTEMLAQHFNVCTQTVIQ